jgi:diaminopimelate epimerase
MEFYKYQGTGNDFIIIDNRKNQIELSKDQIKKMCDRRFGIGADGLMLLQLKEQYDFEMIYFNADGNESSMCGNGGRCLVQFAHDIGIKKQEYFFIAIDGDHAATINDDGWVHLKMKDVTSIKTIGQHYLLNTGSPHYVVYDNDILEIKVYEKGRQIRYSDPFKEEGVNVNFVQVMDNDSIYVRTYERGVEDETLSCGTGVTAAAIVSAHNDRGFNAVDVRTLGGKLRVEFDRIDEDHFENVWLCGPATFVFKGEAILN